jgi:hypothetical protein
MFLVIGYGKKLGELPEIKKPMSFEVDDTQLYVGERSTVYIFSLKDFKLVKKFGSEGQGPQEFQTLPHVPVSIDVSTDKIIAGSIRKVSYFTKKGEFIKEVKGASLAMRLKRCGDNFLSWSQARSEDTIYNTICIFDPQLNKLQEVYRVKDAYQGPGRGYDVLHGVFNYQFYENKIFLPGKDDDSAVDVFNSKMEKLFTVKLDQERRKVDSDFKAKMIHNFKTNPQTKTIYETHLKPLIFSDYFPVISDFFVDDDTLYVMTWKKVEKGNEFFTYDMQGKFKKRLVIPIRYEDELNAYPTKINNGKLYQLVENDNEVWEFHMSSLN